MEYAGAGQHISRAFVLLLPFFSSGKIWFEFLPAGGFPPFKRGLQWGTVQFLAAVIRLCIRLLTCTYIDEEHHVGQPLAAERDDDGGAEPGGHDEDVAQDDVDHPAVALEAAAVGAGRREARTASTAPRSSCPGGTHRHGGCRRRAALSTESLRSVPLFSHLPESVLRPHGRPFQDRGSIARQQADRRRRRRQQVLHHRPRPGRGAQQRSARQRPADRAVDRRRIFRREELAGKAVGRHRPHNYPLRAGDAVTKGPRRRPGRTPEPEARLPKALPNTRSCNPRSIATASGTSTSFRASPRTSRFQRRTSIIRPFRGSTPYPPCRRSSASIPACRICTTGLSTSSKSRCG